jgi:hypothetical protein
MVGGPWNNLRINWINLSCAVSDEICDGWDNDCDYISEEGLGYSFYNGPAGTEGKGECRAGYKDCVGGTYIITTSQVTPIKEDCFNGKDDDCDGKTDGADTEDCLVIPPSNANGTVSYENCAFFGFARDYENSSYYPPISFNITNETEVSTLMTSQGTVDLSYNFLKNISEYGLNLGNHSVVMFFSGNNGTLFYSKPPANFTIYNETCNGKDDDCNTRVDEGFQCAQGTSGCASDCTFLPSTPSFCKDYTTKAQCEDVANNSQIARDSVLEGDTCGTTWQETIDEEICDVNKECSCMWNATTGSCFGYFKRAEDCPEGKEEGNCIVEITAENRCTTEEKSLYYFYNSTWDSLTMPVPSDCIDEEETFPCYFEKLSFFSAREFLISLIVLVGVCIILLKKRRA